MAKQAIELTVVLAKSPQELEPHREALQRLAALSRDVNPFYEPWMIVAALKHLQDDMVHSQFALVYTRESGKDAAPQLCGFFPVEEVRSFHGLPVKAFRLLQHRYCLLSVPLLDPQYGEAPLERFFDWCRSDCGAGLLIFPRLPVDCGFHQLLTEVAFRKSLLMTPERRYTRAIYHVANTPEEYLAAQYSGKARYKLRRKAKLLAEQGTVEYCALEQHPNPEQWLQDFLALEKAGWKGAEGSAMACSESRAAYFLQTSLEALAQKRFVGSSINLNGRMIAGRTVFVAGAGSYLFKIAHSEEHASCSPGNLLEVQTIEHGLPQQVRWTDSCAVPENFMHKYNWRDRRTIEDLVVATGTAWGELIYSAVPVARWVKRRFRANIPAKPSDTEPNSDKPAAESA